MSPLEKYMKLRSRVFFAAVSVAACMVAGASANDSVVRAVANTEQWAIAGHDYANTRFSTAFLPKVIAAFAKLHPGVNLKVEEATALGVERAILSGKLDVGIAFAPPENTELGVDVLFEERLALVLAKDHAWSSRRSIPISSLRQIPLALLTSAFATRRILDAALGPGKLDVKVEMNSVEALIELAKDGGFRPCLRIAVSAVARILPLWRLGRRGSNVPALLLWDAHRYQTAAARAFMAVVRQHMRLVYPR
jgi:DNA-binding transcriptional LysR family regulator